jgi:hypothetical protein
VLGSPAEWPMMDVSIAQTMNKIHLALVRHTYGQTMLQKRLFHILQGDEGCRRVNLSKYQVQPVLQLEYYLILCTRQIHKVSFPLVPQLANLILRKAAAHT